MRRVFVLLAVLVSSHVAAGDRSAEIQIALYPYYHRPTAAWRVTILPDGTARHEQSAGPVKTVRESDFEELEWVPLSERSVPARKLASLWNRLRGLQLATLAGRYSAQYSFLAPDEEAVVETEGGGSYTIPAESTRVVTHGATYGLRINSDELSVNTTVYAPLSALEWEAPRHPERPEILKIVAAWYYVLRAVGPVGEFKAKDFRPYLK